jgi:hypothetical protein
MIVGILLSKGNFCVSIQENKRYSIGYKINPSITIRGNISFLQAISRSLKQHAIESKIKERESNNSPRPILKITGLINITNTIVLIPDLPDANDNLEGFKQALKIIIEGKHKQLTGLELIMKLKGVL